MDEQGRMVPILVAPERLSTLFFGGGRVAMRKAEHLRGCGITVVAESAVPELRSLASAVIERSVDDEALSLIDGHDVVVAATDDESLNRAIVDKALEKGKLVNSVHGGGNFIIPSTRRRGAFVLCASTEGRAPVFPPFLMERSDELFDPAYDSMAELLSELRPIARKKVPGQRERAELLRAVMRDEGIWSLLRSKRDDLARERAAAMMEAYR